MIVDRTPQENAAVSFERPGLSFAAGRYNGYNPLFAGNQPAVGRAADWNWLSLYFSTAQSALQTGAVPTGGKLTNESIFGLYLPDMTQGSVLFAGAGGLVTQNNASFFWDNTNRNLKLTGTANGAIYSMYNTDGEQIRLTQRLSGDGLVNTLTTGGDVRVLDPANGRQIDMTFYTYGCSIDFKGDTSSSTNRSLFEFHGYENSSITNAYHSILDLVCGGDNNHEIQVRPIQDDDGIVLNYPVSHLPVIYTDNGPGASLTLDLGVNRVRMLRMQKASSTTYYLQHTGSATNNNLEYRFYDNGFAGTGTLKGRLLYAGTNSAGSQYLGIINDAADYLALASTTTIFYNSSLGTEYARFTSTGFGVGCSPSVAFQVQGASVESRLTGSATNQTIIYTFYDNNATLEGKFVYAGANTAGNRYFGIVKGSADYLAIASDITVFFNTSFGTEYGRFNSTALLPGSTNAFDLGGASNLWKNVRFGTQAIGPAGAANAPTFTFTGTTDGLYSRTSGAMDISIASVRTFEFDGTSFYMLSNSSTIQMGAGLDVIMARDAAGVWALKNGNTAQTQRTYAGNGANLGIVTVNESLTIAAAASTDSATTIPAGAVILAVAVRVTTVIPTAATFTVTTATGGTTLSTAAVSTAATSTDAGTAAGALYTGAGTKVRITPNINPAAATGVVRLAIMYYLSTPPTS